MGRIFELRPSSLEFEGLSAAAPANRSRMARTVLESLAKQKIRQRLAYDRHQPRCSRGLRRPAQAVEVPDSSDHPRKPQNCLILGGGHRCIKDPAHYSNKRVSNWDRAEERK